MRPFENAAPVAGQPPRHRQPEVEENRAVDGDLRPQARDLRVGRRQVAEVGLDPAAVPPERRERVPAAVEVPRDRDSVAGDQQDVQIGPRDGLAARPRTEGDDAQEGVAQYRSRAAEHGHRRRIERCARGGERVGAVSVTLSP